MDEPIQKMEKDCSAIVDAQFPEIEAHAKVRFVLLAVGQDSRRQLQWPFLLDITVAFLRGAHKTLDTMDQLSKRHSFPQR